jgi:hypothetical protein
LHYLDEQGLEYQSMYIQNMVRVKAAGMVELEWLAARKDVAKIDAPPEAQTEPLWKMMTPVERVEAIEWNISRVHAPEAWAMGINGEGYVVGSNDTGVDYTHPALVNKYRGNLGGGNFDHNYNWWDGPYSTYPADSDGHGTHTTGTMVGDDGAGNQIGVAPGAKWIACAGLGSINPIDCFEFFLAPWDLDGLNPLPSMAPDSINNSWYDPSGFDYRPIIQALNAAGVAVIKSAGNTGPGCSTISNPGAVPEIIATAAFAQGDVIASFSARGPMSTYGETILKPEVAAPGVNVRSSVPGGGYDGTYSGTSMAAPHTTALVTLMWQAAPCIAGDVPLTKQIMMETAEAKIDAQCLPFVDHPNDVWGWGVLDAQAAVQGAMALCGGQGALQGTVIESAGSTPLEAVAITAVRDDNYTRSTTTGVSGYYTTTTPFGTYTVTAELYGYAPGIATNVVVVTDTITTQDFVLDVLPEYTISGTVTEAGSGAPLSAQVAVLNTPIEPVMTDPGTGAYLLTVPAGSYTLRVTADMHQPEERDVLVDGNIVEDFALLTLPCILLVDDDQNNPDVRADYTNALDNAGFDYAVWDTSTDGDPTSADLLGYNIVIWFTAYPYSGTFTSNNEITVSEYLDAGGNFLLSSQDYLYEMGLTPFGTGYLHIGTYDSDVSQTTVTGANPFAGLGPFALSYDFTNYSDTVDPDASGMVAFTGNVGNAAVAYDGASFNTVFLGFPFEAINTLTDRTNVLQAAVDFFGGCAACEAVHDASFIFDPMDPLTGEEVTFTSSAFGTEPIIFDWDFGDGSIGAGHILTHTYDVSGDYTVVMEATNACGTDSYTDIVSVLDPADIGMSIEFFDLPIVIGEGGTAEALISNTGDLTLTLAITETPVVDWMSVAPDAGEINPGESMTITVSFDTTGLEVGEYNAALQLTSNDPDEPWISVPVTLQVLDIAIDGLTAENDSPTKLGNITTLSAEVLAGTNVVYTWDFGDGATGAGALATHTYATSGVFTATVTASNGVSEVSETTLVTIEPAVFLTSLPLVTKTGTPAASPGGMLVDRRLAQ